MRISKYKKNLLTMKKVQTKHIFNNSLKCIENDESKGKAELRK